MEFWAEPSFKCIGNALGRTEEVDLDDGRIKVTLDGFKELVFDTTMEFKGGEYHEGEEANVNLRYERLFGFCELCFSLCHAEKRCPLNPNRSPERKLGPRDHHGGEGGEADRSRSYRGVVINGNGNQKDMGKEKREVYGKGKGKMYEEKDTQWVQVGDKHGRKKYQQKRYQANEEGSSRYRGNKKEPLRSQHQSRPAGGGRGESNISGDGIGSEQEEGEIMASGGNNMQQKQVVVETEHQASAAFQAALLLTQADPVVMTTNEVNSDPVEDSNLTMVKDLMEKKDIELVDEGMEWEGGDESFGNEGDDVQLLTVEEMEKLCNEQVEESDGIGESKQEEEETVIKNAGGSEQTLVNEDKGKKQGGRKCQTKPPLSVNGSNKMRLAQSLASPRKRNAPKISSSRSGGDSTESHDAKGTSDPKQAPLKRP